MEQPSCIREFSRYTVLSVLGTLGVSCYILADTFFVSKGLGTSGLAALNIAIPAYNFIHGTGLMIGMGGATKFSVCKSQGNQMLVDKIYTNTIYLAVLFSIAFMLPGFFCPRQLAFVLGADMTILEMTAVYLRWLLLFSPAFILNDVLLCFVRNDANPQLAMCAMLIGSFFNVIMDYIFIFPLHMGIFGAVFATGISPVISILMMTLHWMKNRNSFHFAGRGICMKVVQWDLSLGFPSLIAQISSGIVMITFNSIILKLEGNTGVAAYGIIANISLVVVAIYTGIAQGAQPLVSCFYGENNREQIQAVLCYAIFTTLALSGILYVLIFVLAQPIAAIFNSECNARLQTIAVTGLKLYFISTPFVGYNIILATFFTSIERAFPAHILSLLRGLILIIPTAFILSSLWKMTGVWFAYPVTEISAALLGFVIYKNGKKRTACH
ncbi:MATE family efflux transporter [uncultured Acetatifactor sp.]|uniref:MATE family efflux transporter n=2 Tax=uncultured Acetatifactor sp. TaxID=1671927 RepID=UPI0026087626|nr:MATE family efflux transporter [uncultured Acetatifactor sp.]MCI8696000.1 MATE family efflux transporter [Lachnospiraceae bacterium]